MKTHFSWLTRFYVSGSVLVTAGIAMLDPGSQHRGIMDQDGYGGAVAIGLLAFTALAGLFDVLINDWLPPRYSLRCTHRHRHLVFMAMAIGQVALAFVEARSDDIRPVMARYLLDACVASLVACLGVYSHYWRTRREDAAAFVAGAADALRRAMECGGYYPPILYAAGQLMHAQSQTVRFEGRIYAPIGATLPFTTSGQFESMKFRELTGCAESCDGTNEEVTK